MYKLRERKRKKKPLPYTPHNKKQNGKQTNKEKKRKRKTKQKSHKYTNQMESISTALSTLSSWGGIQHFLLISPAPHGSFSFSRCMVYEGRGLYTWQSLKNGPIKTLC